MSWWACVWMAFVATMISSWMIGPPISYGGLLLWYLCDLFPMEASSLRPLFPYSIDIRVQRL